MSPSKPTFVPPGLNPEEQKSIAENEARYRGYTERLGTILETVEKIAREKGETGPIPLTRVAELIGLREVAQVNILRSEELGDVIGRNAITTARLLQKSLFLDSAGKLHIDFPTLEDLLKNLAPQRRELIGAFVNNVESKQLDSIQIAKRLGRVPSMYALPEANLRGIDPTRERDAYIATTQKHHTEAGRQAIQNTLGESRNQIQDLTQHHLVRKLAYLQIFAGSLLRMQNEANETLTDLSALWKSFETEMDDESATALYEAFDIDERAEALKTVSLELMQRMEYLMEMIEVEQGVDNILTRLIPTKSIRLLGARIRSKMPEGPNKESALRVVSEAMRRRENIKKQSKGNQTADSNLNLLGIDDSED